jgi:hypothetical protein
MSSKEEEKTSLSSTLVDIDVDFLNTKELITIAMKRNAEGVETDIYDDFEDQYSLYRHHVVVGNIMEYEKWMASMTKNLEKDKKSNGFLSIMTLNAKTEYLHTLRFRDFHCLMKWLRSDDHNNWAKNGTGLCKEANHDVSQGGASFLPSSIGRVARKILKKKAKMDIMMSSSDEISKAASLPSSTGLTRRCQPFQLCGKSATCCGKPFAIEGPPPEWRQSIVIWCSAVSLFHP